jgi:hypothetical protein
MSKMVHMAKFVICVVKICHSMKIVYFKASMINIPRINRFMMTNFVTRHKKYECTKCFMIPYESKVLKQYETFGTRYAVSYVRSLIRGKKNLMRM